MLIATHGRSLWILDDLTPFQKYTEALSSPSHLFAAPAAVQRNAAGDRMRDFEGDRRFFGENPASGVVLTYRLAADAKEVAILVRDPAGAVVREIKGDEVKEKNLAGMQQVDWDLRRAPLPKVKGQEGEGRFGPGDRGPFVLPGSVPRAPPRRWERGFERFPRGARRSRNLDQRLRSRPLSRDGGEGVRAQPPSDRGGEYSRGARRDARGSEEIGRETKTVPEETSAAMKKVEERVTDLKRRLGVGRRDARTAAGRRRPGRAHEAKRKPPGGDGSSDRRPRTACFRKPRAIWAKRSPM